MKNNYINNKNVIKFLTSLVFVFSFFVFTPRSVSAVTCSDGTTGCGITASYNVSASCSMAGSDISGGNRILGGQICSIGGSDGSGYSMSGTDEPKNNTSYFANPGSVAPEWNYSKSAFPWSTIPNGVFNDDPNYNIRIFQSPASINLYSVDDEATFQVGSNFVSRTGCNASVTDVTKDGCPGNVFSGNTNITINPGDPLVLTVTNKLRPNNGYGTWGAGSASISINNTTQCFTKAYFDSTGGRSNGYPSVTYRPTADGVCTPDVVANTCTINSFTAGSSSVSPNTGTNLNFSISGSTGAPTWSITNISSGSVLDNGAGTSDSVATGNISSLQTYRLSCGTPVTTRDISVNVATPSLSVAGTGIASGGSVTVTKGTTVTLPFKFWNSGGVGSVITGTRCEVSSSPGLGSSILNCSNSILTAQ